MLLWIVIAFSLGRGVFVYIKVTVDLRNYLEKEIDLRLSDQYTVRKFIDIVWEIEKLNQQRREGDYIRIENKARILGGDQILADHGVTNGDRLVIL
ncbi:ESX secretion system protein YukD [Siminovitchia terrae]|uniref:ESX secretion system protein YukD n=2 Tax=Siminovitchia terrae TaxID=1914933 RepID=A0ABQ4L466_SIMTE|nr:ESX secretion system protein YukD [Siminovitchia terrae]